MTTLDEVLHEVSWWAEGLKLDPKIVKVGSRAAVVIVPPFNTTLVSHLNQRFVYEPGREEVAYEDGDMVIVRVGPKTFRGILE